MKIKILAINKIIFKEGCYNLLIDNELVYYDAFDTKTYLRIRNDANTADKQFLQINTKLPLDEEYPERTIEKFYKLLLLQ